MIEFLLSEVWLRLLLGLLLMWLLSLAVRHLYADVKLRRDYITALEDIVYLSAVEEQHCQEHQLYTGKTLRTTMRKNASTFAGEQWSGKHTRAECHKKLISLRRQETGWQGLLRRVIMLGSRSALK
jgi:hypothetical protein